MRRPPPLLVLAFALATLVGLSTPSGAVHAQEKPFEVAFFSPVQIRGEEEAIQILRLSFIYGRNVSVKGLDLGLVNHTTGGVSKGLQYGLVGYSEGAFMGWQDNFAANVVEGAFTGLQSGIYNQVDTAEAFQLGIVNRARDMRGFQLGIVNYTETMYGLQIGILNIISQKETLPFLPIVNWSF